MEVSLSSASIEALQQAVLPEILRMIGLLFGGICGIGSAIGVVLALSRM